MPYDRPKMLIASSVRPAPIRPANPTISPRRTVKLEFLQTRRSAEIGCRTVQSRTSKNTSPISGVWSGNRLLQLPADHAPDDPVLVDAVRLDVEGLDRSGRHAGW